MSVRTAPCDWPILAGDCDALVALDTLYGYDDLRGAVETAATAYLWNWTGRVYGLCDVTVRPCRTDCPDVESTYRGLTGHPLRPGLPFVPQLVGGVWRNLACGACGGRCSCGDVEAIRLPGPVDEIVEVTIDGAVLDPIAYRVDHRSILVRDDGGAWPRCQDLAKPAGEDGTWTVAYRWGVPVPEGGQIAAGALACEMAKALTPAFQGECRLPVRVQTITREGVTVAVVDAFEGLEAGRTGLWLVDAWVASVTRSPARSRVYAPDVARPAVTTYRGGE